MTGQVLGHSYACPRGGDSKGAVTPKGRCCPLPRAFVVGSCWGAPQNPTGSCFPHGTWLLSPPTPQVFTLPKVSAKTKFKLTAHEGCRVRKVALVSLASTGSEERLENCLACLTNLGDIHIFTVPGLRPQVHYGCIRKEDISGIASCVFTKHGQGESTRPGLGVLFLVDGTLSLAAAPRGVLDAFCCLVFPRHSRFLLNFTVRVRALLTECQECDGAAVPAGDRPAPGHLLPQVGRDLGPRGLRCGSTPLRLPHGSGSNFSPRFPPATARRRRRSCRRRTARTSRTALRADAPPPTVTVSDPPVPAACAVSPWALLPVGCPPAHPSLWFPRVPRGAPGRLLAWSH